MENKKLSKGEKFKAGVIAYLGAGIVWGVLSGLGIATSDSVISEFIAICVVIFVAVKVYRYFIEKWTKELNTSS